MNPWPWSKRNHPCWGYPKVWKLSKCLLAWLNSAMCLASATKSPWCFFVSIFTCFTCFIKMQICWIQWASASRMDNNPGSRPCDSEDTSALHSQMALVGHLKMSGMGKYEKPSREVTAKMTPRYSQIDCKFWCVFLNCVCHPFFSYVSWMCFFWKNLKWLIFLTCIHASRQMLYDFTGEFQHARWIPTSPWLAWWINILLLSPSHPHITTLSPW